MESTEQIIEEYLRFVKKWFYLTDIKFKVSGPKGGSNYSNIDLIAIDDIKGIAYDIESKFRSAFKYGLNDIGAITEQLLRPERDKAIKEFTKLKPVKVLVIFKSSFGSDKTDKNSELCQEFHKLIKNHNYKSQVWFIENIILELSAEISKHDNKGRYDSGILQTIRLLNNIRLTDKNK